MIIELIVGNSIYTNQGNKQEVTKNFITLTDINTLVQQRGVRHTCLYLKKKGVPLQDALVIIKRAKAYDQALTNNTK